MCPHFADWSHRYMTSYYKKSKNIDILFQNLCFFIKCHEALLKMCWELKVEKFVWVENIVLVDLWCRHTKGTKKVGFDFSLGTENKISRVIWWSTWLSISSLQSCVLKPEASHFVKGYVKTFSNFPWNLMKLLTLNRASHICF